jgi:16S rRNA A1518/A1519 N6-dimethyltransferase RsmA/KsgA/DIM1 with predicted DNA glycosylase/AP lyase activity
MIRLDRKPHPFEQGEQLDAFLRLVRAAFAHRRKTVRYNLARHLDEPALANALRHIDGSERAERIDLHTWIALGQDLLCAKTDSGAPVPSDPGA